MLTSAYFALALNREGAPGWGVEFLVSLLRTLHWLLLVYDGAFLFACSIR